MELTNSGIADELRLEETLPEARNSIEIYGASEHNLKHISLRIPREKLTVITGISGSGKSSLAFDTLYAEGQRRYMESFSAYARSFLGEMKRPEVEKIEGLSPVISIEQKTTSRNPRSTVGTVTEIYDYLRLLYARAGEAFSWKTGAKMIRQSEDQIVQTILKELSGEAIFILAPMVKGRKGHYREDFVNWRKWGYSKVRVDGEVLDIVPLMQVDRYKVHDIEIVVDRFKVKPEDRTRLAQSVQTAMKLGKGVIMVLDAQNLIRHFSRNLMCPDTGLAYDDPAPNQFSFNSPYGACAVCNGLGKVDSIDLEAVIPDKKLSISRGGLAPLGEYREIWVFHQLNALLKKHGFNIATPIKDLSEEALTEVLYGTTELISVNSEKYGRNYEVKYEGLLNYMQKYFESASEKVMDWVSEYTKSTVCSECGGERLRKESLHFRIDGKNIAELSRLDLAGLRLWTENLEDRLDERRAVIAGVILKEIRRRLGFMVEIGLDYLHLDRSMQSLSGGEAQRIRLATQIGSQLVGVLYILDEPSIGLHQRDNRKLIAALQQLRDLGNTVLVVEHDKDLMLAADHLIDIGPGAGRLGGHIVAAGSPCSVLEMNTETADYLSGRKCIPLPAHRREGNGKKIAVLGASGHNLKNVDLRLPLGKMICITGVSGSGKSSLIHETLYPILNQHIFRAKKTPLPYRKVMGIDNIDKVIEVDQSPIGRTPRSNPATYTGVFSDIRNLFAQLNEAKIRGYKPGRFSFNVKGGRCDECEGGGMKVIEMEFLPDVGVLCETCKGKRYNRETLEVRFKGKSISDVLDMTVSQAVEFFENQPSIRRKIKTLEEVGLGYISLGQHATTLSGGEAQRVKLATELSKKDTGQTLYILDEPTTGLHFSDIQHLLNVLHKLADRGNTVLIIEHNLDVIKVADYLIDMGPEGGNGGGEIIAEGSPEELVRKGAGYTAGFLKEELALAAGK
jgi:excinuclease ABC subunit A